MGEYTVEEIETYFRLRYDKNLMKVEVHETENLHKEDEYPLWTVELWREYLNSKQIVFGIQHQALGQLVEDPLSVVFPIIVAKGLPPEKGKDGRVEILVDTHQEMKKDEQWNFRDVMRIPSVKEGEKLAKLVHPSTGVDGKNIFGKAVKALPGKPAKLRPGKNVIYRESDSCYYAEADGQFNQVDSRIQVFPEFYVNDTLSLEVGNLDFTGTIIIRGDVPTGFTVKAAGDVKIFGMVEAATIIAGGSIYIAEGIAGQKRGKLYADRNVQVGYINQAIVKVENDLYVESSIIHSNCLVRGHVYSQQGNIVGGTISAGKSIEAKDIGTRFNTKTEVVLGINKMMVDKEIALEQKKNDLKDRLVKLRMLREKLNQHPDTSPKIRVSKLRQKRSEEVTIRELEDVMDELTQLSIELGDAQKAKLVVRNFIYENVSVSFGKYQRMIDSNYHFIEMKLENREISIEPLFEV
jgi:hypothetical protein